MDFDTLWLLRIPMAMIFLYHGLTKNIDGFAKMFNLSKPVAVLVMIAEISAGLGFIIGGINNKTVFGLTVTQWSAIAVIPVMLGAIFMVHLQNGFSFMNNGYEFQLLILMTTLYLLLNKRSKM